MGLLGHSDADVALHALADAILGAMALGDIGMHFPDTDEQALARSQFACAPASCEWRIGGGKGYKVSNADITIIAQRPKMRPYIDSMRAKMLGRGS